LKDETGEKKAYISQLEWKSARTVFEIRMYMVKVACNCGKHALYVVNWIQQNIYLIIFLCEGNQPDTLTAEMYQEILKKGGPSAEKTIVCDIQQVIENQKKILYDIMIRIG